MSILILFSNMTRSAENFEILSIHGLVLIPHFSGSHFRAPSIQLFYFLYTRSIYNIVKKYPCRPHIPVASNILLLPLCQLSV